MTDTSTETAIRRYNRAACGTDAEEFAEAHRILRGHLLTRPIPLAAHGRWCYAAVERGAIGVVKLAEGATMTNQRKEHNACWS